MGLAVALVAAYALVARAEFPAGAGFAVPTQVVLVPMLLLLPTPTVPLLVALALIITTLIDALRGRVARDRALLSVADAWFALAPAAVLIVGGAQTPDWADWPVYVAALLAMIALDSVIYVARVWACLGEDPRTVLGELKMAHRVDALLFPVGLLAAFAAVDQPYAVLLVVPLAGLFTIFAGERTARVEQAIELSGAYRGTALLLGDVIEADDAYTGQHTQDVVELTVAVADQLGVDHETRRAAEFGALLHDVGKIAIPNEIINKPGPLDDERVGDHEDPHDRGPADARAASAGCSREVGVGRARLARALRRRRLPGRAGRRADPARRADRLGLRRLQRDDHRPLLPQGDEPRGRGRGAARQRRHAVRP